MFDSTEYHKRMAEKFEPFRYEFPGRFPQPLNLKEFSDMIIKDVGTCPEHCVKDRKTGKLISWKKACKIAKLDYGLIEELTKVRMHANGLHSFITQQRDPLLSAKDWNLIRK